MYAEIGQEPPDDVLPPDLLPESLFYIEAFDRLSRDRGFTQFGSPLPIPWSSILRYAGIYGITDLDGTERLSRLMAELDRTFADIVMSRESNPDQERR